MILSSIHKEKTQFYAGIALFLLCLIGGIINENLLVLAIPFVAIALMLFLKDYRIPFYLLMFSIPFSLNLGGMSSVNIDFPDEGLMLLLTALFPFIILSNLKSIQFKSWFQNPLSILLMISFLWMCLAVMFSENAAISVKYLLKRIWYLVPFFFIPLILFQERKLIIRSFQLMFVMLVIIACIVLVRYSAVGFRFEEVHDPIQPFFLNHVMYGSFLSCFIPLSVGALFLSRKLSIQWLMALFGLVIFFIAVYFSYSRAAWMGVLFASGIFVLIRFKLVQWGISLFFILVLTAVLWLSNHNKYLDFKPKFEKTIMHESLEDHIMATIQGTDISSAERYYRWIAAIRMSQDRPVFGVGPNNFYDYYKSYTVTSFRTWVSRNPERSTTHNYFLFMLVEQGYPALILYAALIWMIFFFGQKVYHRLNDRTDRIILMSAICMLASLFINNFFSELLETDKIGSLFLLGIALIVVFHLKSTSVFSLKRK